ncbi:hypothetical protein [Aliarcobacter butzleri]|uniref:hypothetical protein n=1 Tax=Aliarcobacter butzleri TaxID=28197 RepID=UPI002875A4BE|nr:hypothetical protein [Aliarcobacter butzleri]MDS1315783.1 hypothetical protein [Aliarcobacter butzleri]
MRINIKTLKANIYKLISQIKTSSLNYRKKFGITICVLWILIILVIPFNLYFESQNFILVGLAALLASATVIKNIENTNKIEKEKIKRELFDRRKKVVFSISNLCKEVTEKMNDYISLQEIQSLKEVDNFSEEKYIKELIPNLLKKEEYVKKIKEIMDSLDEAEFIFDEVYFKHLSPLMELLLEYYKEISIDQNGLEQKIDSCSKLSNLSFEVLHEIKDSIKLV